MGAITPMLAEIQRRTDQLPKPLLADANHAAHGWIRAATADGVTVLVAVPERSQQPGARPTAIRRSSGGANAWNPTRRSGATERGLARAS